MDKIVCKFLQKGKGESPFEIVTWYRNNMNEKFCIVTPKEIVSSDKQDKLLKDGFVDLLNEDKESIATFFNKFGK